MVRVVRELYYVNSEKDGLGLLCYFSRKVTRRDCLDFSLGPGYHLLMSSYVKRKERESFEAMMRRFNRMVMLSKTLTEAKERRFFIKPVTKSQRRVSAVRKDKIRIERQKELY